MDGKLIVRAMREKLPVVCDGYKYDYISEWICWFDKAGDMKKSLVLINKHQNYTIRVPEEKVELCDD